MVLATGSRSPELERARPRLWMVFAAVGLGALVLALLGMAFVRVYDNQLIRQTESELIAQGVVVSGVYRELLHEQVGAGDYGLTRIAPWPFPAAEGSQLRPILPSLRASDEVLPAAEEPPRSAIPAEPLAQRMGDRLTPLLVHVGRSTLAGIRVVDTQGVVVASSSSGLGTSLIAREEVQRALRGELRSVLRRRLADPEDAPLASLSRDTGVRVTVVLPVLEEDRVWGAVVLSRTPMTFVKAVYADRWNLTATGLVLLGVVSLMSLAAATLVVRPVRALVRQTRFIAASAPEGFEPISRPVVQELAELSESLAGMATALRDRNQYIRSFAANVSHEFKTPLASIQGAVELLRDSADSMSPEQRERFLSNVDADARRLTRLVQRLLELARADSLVARPARTEVGPLLASLAERARAQGLAVEVGAVSPGLSLGLPAEVLEDIVWQLITNASQHGGEGVRVWLEADGVPGEGRGRVVVRDDGKGISESNRARVFDAFFTTARERGGTGLGLTIAQSMLRAFGASLELLPADQKGAAFAVEADHPR
ncbi:ATP-binding protein [Vitiosangium sp. GDMCC 1.1324]|uniref:sensor histidine kinase n=1 Tax=Vitiosangium sp. (strain GDMCC 1.1324) TaxID=2138576 RepID=UPI000D3B7859|nr:ATP-binding protein [Vitiosangium sp. GDMCC 1.1324]PTL85807.1 two-component sensor histidine kinase [Vitiosangium sp. GDMCC 1.1324]